jgi:hypothetical protein
VSIVVVVTTFVPDDPEDEEDVEGTGVVVWTVEDWADGW